MGLSIIALGASTAPGPNVRGPVWSSGGLNFTVIFVQFSLFRIQIFNISHM